MTYRRTIWDYAVDNYGYVTTADAARSGVPPGELPKLAQRGGLTNVAYGLYRVDDVPITPYDQYCEAVLRVGEGAHLTRDAVLSLHDLGLVNPRRIRVGLARRTQAQLPEWIEVVRENLADEDLTVYEGIPSATVARALIDSRGLVMASRLREAAAEAARRGLLHRQERQRVEDALQGIPA